jgi:hypothetical protein
MFTSWVTGVSLEGLTLTNMIIVHQLLAICTVRKINRPSLLDLV